MAEQRKFKCADCGHEWQVACGSGKPGREMVCPKCGSRNIYRNQSRGKITKLSGNSLFYKRLQVPEIGVCATYRKQGG